MISDTNIYGIFSFRDAMLMKNLMVLQFYIHYFWLIYCHNQTLLVRDNFKTEGGYFKLRHMINVALII